MCGVHIILRLSTSDH